MAATLAAADTSAGISAAVATIREKTMWLDRDHHAAKFACAFVGQESGFKAWKKPYIPCLQGDVRFTSRTGEVHNCFRQRQPKGVMCGLQDGSRSARGQFQFVDSDNVVLKLRLITSGVGRLHKQSHEEDAQNGAGMSAHIRPNCCTNWRMSCSVTTILWYSLCCAVPKRTFSFRKRIGLLNLLRSPA